MPNRDRRFISKIFLFLKTKIRLKGQRFSYIADIHVELQTVPDCTMIQVFKRCF